MSYDLSYILSKQQYHHSEALGALADATAVKVLIKCPAAGAAFFGAILDVDVSAFGGTLGGASLVEICEAPTTSSDGTARTPRNANRLDTPLTTTIGVFLNTDATGGTVLQAGQVSLGESFKSDCFILKPAVNYLVRVTNQSGDVLINGTINVKLKQIPTADQMYRKKAY